jgi:hypothetical protein
MVANREYITDLVTYTNTGACLLLAPGFGIMMIAFIASGAAVEPRIYCGTNDTLAYRVTVPTLSQIFEYWPYIAPLLTGTGITCLFTAVVLVSVTHARGPIRLAFVSTVSMWGIVGTSMRGDIEWIQYLHVALTSVFFITSFLLLLSLSMLPVSNTPHTYTLLGISAASLIISMVAGITAALAIDASLVYYIAYECLAIGELVYAFFFCTTIYRLIRDLND